MAAPLRRPPPPLRAVYRPAPTPFVLARVRPPPPESASFVPLAIGAAVVVAAGGGAWWWLHQRGDL